jgi:hypothetical protein
MELIRVFSNKCNELNVFSGSNGKDILYTIDSSAIFSVGLAVDEVRSEEEAILTKYNDNIDLQFTENIKNGIFEKWKTQCEARGIGSADARKVFETSPQYYSTKSIVETGLSGHRGQVTIKLIH